MKSYPTIQRINKAKTSGYFYGFNKLDGSLIRVKWSKKRGLHDYGRRNGLLDDSNPYLLEAPALVENHQEDLNRFLRDSNCQNAVLFWEFFGPNSFAGNHMNEFHKVVLVDIAFDKKGLVDPKILIELPDWNIPAAELIYSGNINQDVIRAIETSTLEGMTFEGVVFKRQEKGHRIMCKHKSRAWLDKLKIKCGGDEKLFNLLQ